MAEHDKPTDDRAALKDQRVQLMMTEAEVRDIDDWSFENRIRGRAEAIRQLCALGLEAARKSSKKRS